MLYTNIIIKLILLKIILIIIIINFVILVPRAQKKKTNALQAGPPR